MNETEAPGEANETEETGDMNETETTVEALVPGPF